MPAASSRRGWPCRLGPPAARQCRFDQYMAPRAMQTSECRLIPPLLPRLLPPPVLHYRRCRPCRLGPPAARRQRHCGQRHGGEPGGPPARRVHADPGGDVARAGSHHGPPAPGARAERREGEEAKIAEETESRALCVACGALPFKPHTCACSLHSRVARQLAAAGRAVRVHFGVCESFAAAIGAGPAWRCRGSASHGG
eukprot:224694-Chlamydomonas_euryale.AAC.2